MKKNEKRKPIIRIILILSILIFLIGFVLYHMQIQYKKAIHNYSNQLLEIIIEKYPEVEEDIIKEIFIDPKANTQDILKKYGIEEENIQGPKNSINFTRGYYLSIIVIMLIGSLGIVFLWIYYQNKQTKNMKKLDKYCRDIINGNEILELKNQKEGFEGILKNNIYDMTMILKEKNDKLEKNKLETEKLIADISHQLKTPLTSLNLMNDLLYTNLPEKKRKEFLDNSSKELEKINWLIKTLLNIAKLDSKTILLKKENEDADKMLNEIKTNFQPMCEIYHANIQLEIKEKPRIYCDKKWTIEAISNILKNALEHKGKNIIIEVEENQVYTQIIITDDGEGISQKDIGHIFDRFYKSESSKEESLGLGLAFCKSIIKNQEGEIKVQSKKTKEGNWTKFIIKLYQQ